MASWIIFLTNAPYPQYHDDGEAELGPTVAALALGSPSLMKFRPKKRSGFGLPMTGGRSPQYMDVLEVPMKHGDMMVMHGSRIQGLYEVGHCNPT